MQYADNGAVKIDRVTGTIRWVKDSQRKINGLGQYEYDIRVNEPAPDASGVFAPPTDESAFFASNTSVPGLNGTMKYRDTIKPDGTEDGLTCYPP